MRFRCADAVSQILDYAKEISRWSYEELNHAVRRAAKRPGDTNTLFDLVQEQNDTIDEQTFVDDVTRNLKSGRFLLLVVGDGIREGVERIADYLKQSAGIRFTFGLVELAIFDMPDGSASGIIVEPRVLARTFEIERAVVRLADAGVVVEDPPFYRPALPGWRRSPDADHGKGVLRTDRTNRCSTPGAPARLLRTLPARRA